MVNRDVFCVTSTESVGCTFLDWSIHWLSGTHQTYVVNDQRWHKLCQDPLSNQSVDNAHGHKKNHPSGFQSTQLHVEILDQICGTGGKSLYPFPLHLDVCCEKIKVDIGQVRHDYTYKQVLRYQIQDYQNMISWLAAEKSIPCIFVALDPNVLGYKWCPRSIERLVWQCKSAKTTQDLIDEQQNVFFSESQTRWQDLGLINIWDQRERMALDIRPFDPGPYDDLDIPDDHLWINCQDLWFDTHRTLMMVMDWLHLPVVQDRLHAWLPIMHRWQMVHNDALKFYRRLPKIVRSIVKGVSFPLPDLSLYQEAIVQHCLIYHYGLNLKTWQLSRFPNNTKNLHEILEPNCHPID